MDYTSKTTNLHTYLFIGYIAVIASLIFVLINYFGRMQFSGMDGGVLVNAAYMGRLGFQYYRDVITATPPLFLIGTKLSFMLFGVHWYSVVLVTALFAVTCFIAHTLMLRRVGWSIFWSLLFSFYCQAVINITISFWWYNRITVSLILLFFTAVIMFFKQPKSVLNQSVLIVITGFLVLSKINMAAPALFLVVMIMFTTENRKTGLTTMISGVFFAICVMYIFNINPFEVIKNYSYAGGRILQVNNWLDNWYRNYNWEAIRTTFYSLPALIGFIWLLFFSVKNTMIKRISPQIIIVILGMFIISFWGMGTNNDYNMVDGALALCVIVMFYNVLKDQLSRRGGRIISVLLCISIISITVNAISIGFNRYNVEAAGYGGFYEQAPLTKIETPLLFSDVFVGPRLIRTINQIESVLVKMPNKNLRKIFFGPRVDWAYAAYDIAPPVGLPLWWESFSDGKSIQSQEMIARFKNKDFNAVILFYRDYTFFPAEIVTYLNENYQQTDYQDITIYTPIQ